MAVSRDDLAVLLRRTQRIAAKLGELGREATAGGRPSIFITAQVEDLEHDLARVIEDEMDRRLRVRQFVKAAAPTRTDGITVVREHHTRAAGPLSGQWGRRASAHVR